MKTEKSCNNCIYSIPDWTNVCNSDHYCSNEESEEYGYNAEYLNGCDEWKSIEPNLGNNGSICTKTGSNDEDRTTDDCISRKQAIEAFEPIHYKDWYTPTIIETLETLPSVRPELPACGSGELVKESDGLVNDLVKDCISRQAAIDALMEHFKRVPTTAIRAKHVIEKLPSAQPERKKGHWIVNTEEEGIISGSCSVCGWQAYLYEDDVVGMNFCPNCGARMVKEGEEHV